MRVLLIDWFGGDGMLDIALRAQQAGHTVKWFFRKGERNQQFGKGLVTTVDDWRDWIRWADVSILADNTHYLKEIDRWRKEGCCVVGATEASAVWELVLATRY